MRILLAQSHLYFNFYLILFYHFFLCFSLYFLQRCYQDQGGRDQDQDQDLKKVVLIGL